MTQSLAHELFEQAFEKPRAPRSAAYKDGVLACLNKQLHAVAYECPFVAGSEAFDAYFSGIGEGWEIVTEYRRRNGL